MPGRVVVADTDAEVLARLKNRYPQVQAIGADLNEAAAQEVVFLALHPPVMGDALGQIKASIREDGLLVSLAPKLLISKLSDLLGGFDRIARAIPNAASIVGKGYNPVAFGAGLTVADKDGIKRLLTPLGDLPEVPEEHLEAYAIVTAMGPTYFWPQLYELRALAQSFGLSADDAMQGVERMMSGALATMKESGLSTAEVQDLVPVKPLAEASAAMVEAYRTTLTGLMSKLKA
jgi:pyrroline-5-carboxylate reductase